MTKMQKLVSAVASSAFMLAVFAAPAAAADISCTIRGNGARSRNRCVIVVTRLAPPVDPSAPANDFTATNNVVIGVTTGGNHANNNTGDGNVSVDPGNGTVNVTITNSVN